MILRLELIAGAFDLSQDATFLLFFFEKAAKTERHRVEKCNARKGVSVGTAALGCPAGHSPATVFKCVDGKTKLRRAALAWTAEVAAHAYSLVK